MFRRTQLFVCILALFAFASPHAFDHDTAQDCAERIEDCTSDKTTFFECPITCAQALEPPTESRASSGRLDDVAFYQLKATDVNGKKIDFENYEGYVTVIAAVPRQAGVAQFYYEMLEHLHDVYPYTLEILVVPLEKGGTGIVPLDKAKVSVLKEPHPVLTLLKKGLHGGNLQSQGKATLYLVGANGDSVEAFVSTSMPIFQRYLRYHFVQELGQKNNEF